MGQNRKNGQGSAGGMINFNEELSQDVNIEKSIFRKQLYLMMILVGLVLLRETFYPSHVYVVEVIRELMS